MASIDADPFVADVLEARQHDELVAEHFFEANTDDEGLMFLMVLKVVDLCHRGVAEATQGRMCPRFSRT